MNIKSKTKKTIGGCSDSQKKNLQPCSPKKKFSSRPREKKNLLSPMGLVGENGKEKKNPSTKKKTITKTQVLFCPSCCVDTHQPTPPLESQQKTCVFGIVGTTCDQEARTTARQQKILLLELEKEASAGWANQIKSNQKKTSGEYVAVVQMMFFVCLIAVKQNKG